MINKYELLAMLNIFDNEIQNSVKSEAGKAIHKRYMDLFRSYVTDMKEEKPKDRLILGFEIGLWTELVIILFVLKITGTI
jgi:hypothetical protein